MPFPHPQKTADRSGSFQPHWIVEPSDGRSFLPFSTALERLTATFPTINISVEAGREYCRQRLTALTAVGAPQEIRDIYAGDPPAVCQIVVSGSSGLALDLHLWPNQTSTISFVSRRHYDACLPLAQQLAEALGYELLPDEDG